MFIPSKKTRIIKLNLKKLRERLSVNIELLRGGLNIEGDALKEYEAERVIDAINEGFKVSTALMVLDEDIAYEKIFLKDHTRRKNLEVIRGRLIGSRGKTKNTLEEITDCEIKIHDNHVVLIGPAINIQNSITAIINIIKGAKQTNAYKYLERINTQKRKINQHK